MVVQFYTLMLRHRLRLFEQAWEMLNYITDQGVTYFAFNTKIQSCKHNTHFFGKVCPECGEPVFAEYSRIDRLLCTNYSNWFKGKKKLNIE